MVPRVMHIPYCFGVQDGVAKLYEAANNQVYMVCPNSAHGRCVLTRTLMASDLLTASARGQGRPLGLMLLWAEQAFRPMVGCSHVRLARMPDEFPYADRASARSRHASALAEHGFLDIERAKRALEPDEPMDI